MKESSEFGKDLNKPIILLNCKMAKALNVLGFVVYVIIGLYIVNYVFMLVEMPELMDTAMLLIGSLLLLISGIRMLIAKSSASMPAQATQ